MPELKPGLTPPTREPPSSVPDLEERNRQLEEALATTVHQLSQEIRERAAINRSLEGSLENFRNVLEKLASGVIIVNHEGVARYANPLAAELLGWNRADMLGQLFGVPVAEGDAEMDLLRGDGLRAIARMRVIPTSWEGEEAQLIVLRDVTTEKLQELELSRLNRALNAVYRCSEIIVRAEDEAFLLEGVCQSMVETGGYATVWIGLCGMGRPADLVEVASASEMKDLQLDGQETACRHVQEALRSGQTIVVQNAKEAPGDGPCEAMLQMGCDAAASMPLFWEGRPFGVLTVYSTSAHAFSPAELQLLSRLADDLSYAIASFRARVEQERLRDSLRYLSSRVVQLQEEERRNIARELHDEIGQMLTALKIAIDRTAQGCQRCGVDLAEVSAEVSQLIEQVRNLSLSLRPAMLDDLGLLPTLKWHFDRYTSQTSIRVDFQHGKVPRDLPRDTITTAYRVVQEGLTNVARHAQAGEVMVRVRSERGALCVAIKDEGVGFDLDDLREGGGAGLGGMRERVISAGGTLAIDSSPGCGTYIVAELPLPRSGAAARKKRHDTKAHNSSPGG